MTIGRHATTIAALLALAGLVDRPAFGGEDEPKHGGVLRYAVVADAPTYDCHAADSFATLDVVAPHYSTLLRIDPARYPQVGGDLAESWEVGEDARLYIFHLHPDIYFHDGSLLTASDVKASFDRIRDPPPRVTSVRKSLYEDIVSIETPDDRTVVFRLRQPNAAMLALLASPWNCVYSGKLLQENPDYPSKLVMGSGPFRFIEHVAGSKWVGRRFENYFRSGLPYLDGFEAYVVSSAALTNALEGGQVTAEFRGVSPAERDRLKRAMGDRIKFQEVAGVANFQLIFNAKRKPFDDVRVRRALSLAIDRWTVEHGLRRTTSVGITGGLLLPGSTMARTAQELEPFPGFWRDAAAAKAEARRLLKEARQENLRVTLANRTVANPYLAIGIYAIDQWRQIGVAAEQEMLETSRWAAAAYGGNFDVIVDAASDFSDEPALQLAHYLSQDRAPANLSGTIDRVLDDLYDQQQRTTDPAERAALVRAFEARVLQQAYVAPISWRYRITPLAAKVMGYVTTPSIYVNQDLAEVWLDR